MSFAAQKYELIYFNKGRKQWKIPANLMLSEGESTSAITPVESAIFLGV